MQPKNLLWPAAIRIFAAIALTLAFTSSAHAASEQVLYSFTLGSDGGEPYGNLVFDSAGNLYGTTSLGGNMKCDNGCGTVFELTPASGGGWTQTVIHTFEGGNDGAEPVAGLAIDAAGNLYGTTAGGGNSKDLGTVFKLTHGSGGWTETVIHRFTGGKDGFAPYANVILDGAGNLYGTTSGGGKNNLGIVFELSPTAGGKWTEKILRAFPGGNGGGAPNAVIFDASGDLIGTTYRGGPAIYHESGIVYKLTKNSGGGWKETVLYSFTGGADGMHPEAGVILDNLGNIYGTTYDGGSSKKGVVFQLSPGSGGWTQTVLHTFTTISQGQNPRAPLLFDGSGNLYGTTAGGGVHGTVFELIPGSGGWTYNLLYNFPTSSSGSNPYGGVIFDTSGSLYGTTLNGGASNYGTVYKVTP
jgi:uncharacterized repeat protein (TIGR03803 family)